jgi:hypothetical protein
MICSQRNERYDLGVRFWHFSAEAVRGGEVRAGGCVQGGTRLAAYA